LKQDGKARIAMETEVRRRPIAAMHGELPLGS
jgi:hypothetical protein